MNKNLILKTDILDIIFEKRNKAYGAYDLRKFYPGRLKLALGFMFIIQPFLPLAYSNLTTWNLIMVNLVFDIVFWIIIAVSLTAQVGIKKRNIFLEK